MEDLTYTPIGSVLHLNKAGELAQKRMNAAKLCDGLYITEPDKTQFVKFIVEYNGVKWVEHQAPQTSTPQTWQSVCPQYWQAFGEILTIPIKPSLRGTTTAERHRRREQLSNTKNFKT